MKLLEKLKLIFAKPIDIEEILDKLRQHEWFIQLYSNPRFRELIHSDELVHEFLQTNYSDEIEQNESKLLQFQNEFIDTLISRS